jgi:hypothetical protein
MEEVNNKKRPAGSGTTTGKRREQRQAKQWNTLQQANPPVTTAAAMEEQLEALKKATESAQKQLAELEKAEQQQKKAANKMGKTGPRSPEEWAAASGSKPKLVSLEQIQREQYLKTKLASLKKEMAAKAATGSSSSGAEASLKKDKSHPNSLKKDVPLVIIDWHNTLEVNDALPDDNLDALKKVLEVAHVRIISWVNSEVRRKSTLQQIRELIPTETLKKVQGYQTIWYKCGEGGKVHWATHYKAEALFDDQPAVCEEARDWGLVAFPIAGNKPHKGSSFWTFADAAESYLKQFDA